jgi:inorganic pyrophosphatase
MQGRNESLELEILIEIPRGGFRKRGLKARTEFISPFPCPFNYGSVENYLGLDGDPLDAVVLGPRLRRGDRVRMQAVGAVGVLDGGTYEDKIICSPNPIGATKRFFILLFFRFYLLCKELLYLVRMRPGRYRCRGWTNAAKAIHRAKPLQNVVSVDLGTRCRAKDDPDTDTDPDPD